MKTSTLNSCIEAAAKLAPNAAAVRAPGRDPLSHIQLRALLSSTESTLRRAGVGRRDRVAVVLPNGPEMATAFLAVAASATCAPLNPAFGSKEFDFYLDDLSATALIVLGDDEGPAVEVARQRGIQVLRLVVPDEGGAGSFVLRCEEEALAAAVDVATLDDIALVLHTSGTTSRPKMVPLSHGNLTSSAVHIAATLGLEPTDTCLNIMPLFHIHGLMAAVLAPIAAGGSVYCSPGFFAPSYFDWLDDSAATYSTAVPTMHQSILEQAKRQTDRATGSHLRFLRSSSSALAPTVLAELEATFGVPVVEAYGMTEAAHQMACNPLPPAVRKPGSVGPAAGPEVAVMGEAGDLLPAGKTGEVVIRGPNVITGYTSPVEANADAFRDGWFRTGDQGHLDDDGYLTLTGRLKEIINRGGEKISPREIDEALLEHPAVAQGVTFAVPHPKLGEDIAAAVVVDPSRDAIDEMGLRTFLAERLVAFKVPFRILFLEELPKGPTGKLQRIGLAKRLGVTIPATIDAPTEYVAPRNEVEEYLVAAWADVLRQDRIGVHDRFLAAGGDSMLATQLVARIQEELDIELTLIGFFAAPTVAEQAALVEAQLLRDA
ncbi:MAG: AMP-binding protein [Planctomycetota bacterium]